MIEYILTIGIITVICLMVEILFHNHIGLYSFDVRRTNSLRGILAILIILHHLSSKIDISFLKWFHDFGAPIVSMFFFVSGYGLIKSYLKKGSTYIDGFLAKRLGKVLPIYFIGSFVMALVTIYNVDDFGGVYL